MFMNEDEELEDEEAGDELKNSKVPKQLQPYMYKKGQSGNPKGRPEGISMKEYVKRKFRLMTDEEREEYLEGINKKDIWEMAEAKAESKTDITTNGKDIVSISDEDRKRLDALLNDKQAST